MADNPVILITRPEPQASRYARELAGRLGPAARIHVVPLRIYEFLEGNAPPPEHDAVAFTSEAGVRAAEGLMPDKAKGTAFVVGSRTGECAAARGWKVESAEATGRELAELVAARIPGGRVLWICGEDTRPGFPELAAALGVRVNRYPAYRLIPTGGARDAAAIVQSAGAALVPVFSPQEARAAASALGGHRDKLHLVAISDAAARAFGHGRQTTVAERPDGAGVSAAIAAIFPSGAA